MAKVTVAMMESNGKCLLSKHNFSSPSSFKGLSFLSCMLWYVLVRSQIKFDTYLVEYLNRKCTEANQEQSTKKKKNQSTEQTFWTFGRGIGRPESPWLFEILIVIHFAIFWAVIYLYVMQCVWGFQGLMPFWKMCFFGIEQGKEVPFCHLCSIYHTALVIC